MKRNKILASLLALSLTLGLAVPAFAAGTPTEITGGTDELAAGSYQITIGSQLKIPTLKVTIGTTSDLIVNPYKMTYNGGNDTLISTPTKISSKSDIGVKIDATPTATKTGDAITFVSSEADIQDSDTTPKVYMILKMDTVADETAAGSYTGANGTNTTTPSSAVIKDSAPDSPASITMNPGNTTAQFGAFIITGKSGGQGWASGNSISVKVVFDISPVVGTGTAT